VSTTNGNLFIQYSTTLIMKTIYFILIFLILPLCHYGQSFLDVEGTWQLKADKTSFCNIIMMEDEWNGKPLVVLEGMLNEEPFKIRCRVEEIRGRQAIALYELAEEDGSKSYDSDRPVICFIMEPGGNIAPLWCQIEMAKKEIKNTKKKTLKVKKITIPNYKEKYQFVPFEESTALILN
jgi:hypothetical protein